MKNYTKIVLLALFPLMSLTVVKASPEKPAAGRHWQLEAGDNTAEVSTQGIHINQRLPANTTRFANASTKLIVADAAAWKIGFDVSFGTLRPSGAVVRLYKGNSIVGWVGADVWTKNMGICTGDHNFKFIVPADSDWHRLEYVCDGKTLSVWHNGKKVGEDASQGAPDRVFVGSDSPGKDSPTQQTEIWLRDVQEETLAVPQPIIAIPAPVPDIIPSQASSPSTQPLPQRITLGKDASTATLPQTLDWMAKALISSGKILNSDGTDHIIYTKCDYDLFIMTLNYRRHDLYAGGVAFDVDTVVPLGKMDSLQVTVSMVEKDTYKVQTDSINKLDCVSATEYNSIDNDKSVEHQVSASFFFPDKNIAERFAKALRHAILLSVTYKSNDPF